MRRRRSNLEEEEEEGVRVQNETNWSPTGVGFVVGFPYSAMAGFIPEIGQLDILAAIRPEHGLPIARRKWRVCPEE